MQRTVFQAALALVAVAALVVGDPPVAGQDKQTDTIMKALPDKAPATPKAKRKLLIYSKTLGFRHGSIGIGTKVIQMMGDKTGAYTAHITEDESFFEPEKLKFFDAVFMLNTTGDCLRAAATYVDDKGEPIAGARETQVDQKLIAVDAKGKPIEGAKVAKVDGKDTAVDSDGKPIPDARVTKTAGRTAIVDAKGEELPTAKKIVPDPKGEERRKQSLIDFVTSGKGLAGCHSATDTYGNWKEYNMMMGGAFAGHPWTQKVPIKNVEPTHPLNAAFNGEDFEVDDEIYQFRLDTAQPADRKFLLVLDTSKMDVSKGNRKETGPYPVSWLSNYGKGRTFYCSLGHRDQIYTNPVVLKHYLAGIQYVLGDLEADASPTGK